MTASVPRPAGDSLAPGHGGEGRGEGAASPTARRAALGALALLLIALPQLPVPEFWITQLNYIGLYALVALGLVLLTGIGGLTSFGQAAFVGIGAYATGYVTSQLGWSPWVGLPLGLVLTAATALLLGVLTLRMSGHYLPLATIAWCLALFYLMGNLDMLGKYDGLLGVPPIDVLGFSFREGRRLVLPDLGRGHRRRRGARVPARLPARPRDARAERQRGGGTTMPEAMGASTFHYKVTMFLIAALLASVSGWLFAHMQRNVNPSPFGIKLGIEYLFMAVVGGIGSVWGAFVGAGVVKLLEDQLQVCLPRLSAPAATSRSSCSASCWW